MRVKFAFQRHLLNHAISISLDEVVSAADFKKLRNDNLHVNVSVPARTHHSKPLNRNDLALAAAIKRGYQAANECGILRVEQSGYGLLNESKSSAGEQKANRARE